MSRQDFFSLLVVSVAIGAFLSRQIPLSVDIKLTNLVAISSLFVSADLLHSSHVLLRHAVFCRDMLSFVAT